MQLACRLEHAAFGHDGPENVQIGQFHDFPPRRQPSRDAMTPASLPLAPIHIFFFQEHMVLYISLYENEQKD
jgi:hypothetical protein